MLLIGSRLCIKGDWDTEPTPTGRTALSLVPAPSVFSPAHPTTTSLLAYMEGLVFTGKTVVDWGCGNGILGMAAALFGATTVIATDVKDEAIDAATRNLALNGLGPTVTIRKVSRDFSDAKVPKCDYFIANLDNRLFLEAMVPKAVAALRVGGSYLFCCTAEDTPEQRRERRRIEVFMERGNNLTLVEAVPCSNPRWDVMRYTK